jgi:hypothetical protein
VDVDLGYNSVRALCCKGCRAKSKSDTLAIATAGGLRSPLGRKDSHA